MSTFFCDDNCKMDTVKAVIVATLVVIAVIINVYMWICCQSQEWALPPPSNLSHGIISPISNANSTSTATGTSTATSKNIMAKVSQDKYTVVELPGLLTSEQCDRIVAVAKANGMGNAETIDDKDKDRYSAYNPSVRTSKTTFLRDSMMPELEYLATTVEKLTGLPRDHQEQLQVASYESGGEFKDHYDACDSTAEICTKFNHNAGHRVSTLLVYLNDDYEGGSTVFPVINKVVKPEKGKGVYFVDVDQDENIIKESIHRGEKVFGTKWICTK